MPSIESSNHQTILIKYGGNAMTQPEMTQHIMHEVSLLKKAGHSIVMVHGGGPFIARLLDLAKISSEFIGGHRKTTVESIRYIEMALKGEVNGELVRLSNALGMKAVGLSGKDGNWVGVKKREFFEGNNSFDLGLVGDIVSLDTSYINLLLQNDYLPVVASLAMGADGNNYNVNADAFAGQLAGSLKVDAYIVLTDVDGLMQSMDDPDSIIPHITCDQIAGLKGSVIKGGMIPKIDSCQTALNMGAKRALILNGIKPLDFQNYLLSPERHPCTIITR
ncbi:MAG: acetylglutamate kinase [Cyclobacteriaceae bacterium]|nr:acetylglutamate kinase [Cyclobacteriaceae bacterium]